VELRGHVLGAFVDEGGHVKLNLCRTVEGRERPRKDVTSFPEWLAFVVVVAECVRFFMITLRGDQDGDQLYAVVREPRCSQNEHRTTFVRERISPQMMSPRSSSLNAVTALPPSRQFSTPRDLPRRTARLQSGGADEDGRRLEAGLRCL